jgi:hypothetical protein
MDWPRSAPSESNSMTPPADRLVCQQHEWETGSWGVIIGVSRCTRCQTIALPEHFPVAALTPPADWLARLRFLATCHGGPNDVCEVPVPSKELVAAVTALTAAEALCQAVEDIQRQPWPPNWARVHDTARALRAALGAE